MPLSKSDFALGSSCAKKLVYKKALFETANDSNEYMEMLAQGGYIIAKYAQLMYPGGVEVKSESLENAIEDTRRLIQDNENITLFEGTFSSKGKIIRTDIFEKRANVINLIEVKSKSYDSEDDAFNSKRKLEEYIEDVSYQTLVLIELYPNFQINSFLLLPDKSKRTRIDQLAGWFRVSGMVEENFEIEELRAQNVLRFKKPFVEFKFEESQGKEKYLELLRSDNLLTLVPLNEEVKKQMEFVSARSKVLMNILDNGIKPEDYALSKKCKECEFNLGEVAVKNGYRECWQERSDVNPHIFDLYFGGAIGHYKSGWYLDELIAKKKVSFWDLDPERFKDSKGNLGARGIRQTIQYENTKRNEEWFGDGLSEILGQMKYPLHFIDFETYSGAIPHHKGMRPYELVAFQWSCHTIRAPGSAPVHSEYLNMDYDFPNFHFAESLMAEIGNSGTPLMWTPFENTILRNILEQMDIYGYKNDTLRKWLIEITTDKKEAREGRFVDLNEITLKYYFHPDMNGRTSIKKVLPAIWKNNLYLHSDPWFAKYAIDSASSLNPYDALSPIINQLEDAEVVKDGTGAMKAYNELMFGDFTTDIGRRNQIKQLLLQYCELDTMAMVVIWKYWSDKCRLLQLSKRSN